MKIQKKILILLGLLSSTVLVIVVARIAISQETSKRAAYTIVWKGMFQYPDGREQEAYTETRYVSSSGNWRSIKRYTDGRTQEMIAEVERGVFSVRPAAKNMYFLSEYPAPVADPEALRSSPAYSRTETILGYTAYVLTNKKEQYSVESFHAPVLNGDLIKHVYRSGPVVNVLEPVSITLGEPAPELLQHEEYPVDYTTYSERKDQPPQQRKP